MRPETVLVSIMHGNNEVGTVQDVAAIARVAHSHGALLHCNAAQSIGNDGQPRYPPRASCYRTSAPLTLVSTSTSLPRLRMQCLCRMPTVEVEFSSRY